MVMGLSESDLLDRIVQLELKVKLLSERCNVLVDENRDMKRRLG